MDTKERIINIICNNLENISINDILDNQNDLLKLGINSIVFIKIIVELEKELDIEFDDEMLDYQKFNSLDVLCDYVDKCLNDSKTEI